MSRPVAVFLSAFREFYTCLFEISGIWISLLITLGTGSIYLISVESSAKYSFNSTRVLLSNDTLLEGLRRRDNVLTPFHQSRVSGGAAKYFLAFCEMISDIRLLMSRSRSIFWGEILDFVLISDLSRGVIHARSRDEIETVLTGIHLSTWSLIFSSRRHTASSTSEQRSTSPQFTSAWPLWRAPFLWSLQSHILTSLRIGFNFVPAGITKLVWSVLTDLLNRSGRFIRQWSKYVSPYSREIYEDTQAGHSLKTIQVELI